VRIRVGEVELTRELTVEKDPHSEGTEADIRVQVNRLLEIRDNLNSVAERINQIEWIRKQIDDLHELLQGDEDAEPIVAASKELEEKLRAIEDNFFDLRLAWVGQDTLRWPDKLHTKLVKLAGYIEQTDHPPTTQQIEVHEMFKQQLAKHENELAELLEKDLPEFNNLLEENEVSNIMARKDLGF
jgi:hypothetical protein